MDNKSFDLINRINSIKKLSKGQKLIVDYITNHYDKAAFMTAARLGEAVGVSESTVVRFALELGYEGYPKMQKVLQEMVKNKLTAIQRMEISSSRIDEYNILKSVLQSDMEKIKITL
ncbi:MAG: N-acetylmannosamine kinase, partial [Acetivibrionales bacterium]